MARSGQPGRSQLAADVLEFGELHKVGTGPRVGEPWRWHPFQVQFIEKLFPADGSKVKRGILSIGRRGGKTGTAAMLVLAGLYGPLARRESLILSASMSAKQAQIVYEYAKKLAIVSGQSHGLKFRDHVGEIEYPGLGTKYRAISAGAETAVGFGARMVVFDEIGQVRGPRFPLYENLDTAMGTYPDSFSVILSTQAASDQDLFSLLIDDALMDPGQGTVLELWTADLEDDIFSEETWRKAQPTLGTLRDLDDVRQLAEQARRMPAREAAFRNLVLNQRVDQSEFWLTRQIWEQGSDDIDWEVFQRNPVHVGIDLSARRDLTAMVMAAIEDGVCHVATYCWTPAEGLGQKSHEDRVPYDVWHRDGALRLCPGRSIAVDDLAEEMISIWRDIPNLMCLHYDPWRWSEFERALERQGFIPAAEPFRQGYKSISPAIEAVEHLAFEGQLRHGGHPILRWCVANSKLTRDPAGNRKLDKSRSFGRIDAAIAMLMAVSGAVVEQQEQGYWVENGLAVLSS